MKIENDNTRTAEKHGKMNTGEMSTLLMKNHLNKLIYDAADQLLDIIKLKQDWFDDSTIQQSFKEIMYDVVNDVLVAVRPNDHKLIKDKEYIIRTVDFEVNCEINRMKCDFDRTPHKFYVDNNDLKNIRDDLNKIISSKQYIIEIIDYIIESFLMVSINYIAIEGAKKMESKPLESNTIKDSFFTKCLKNMGII